MVNYAHLATAWAIRSCITNLLILPILLVFFQVTIKVPSNLIHTKLFNPHTTSHHYYYQSPWEHFLVKRTPPWPYLTSLWHHLHFGAFVLSIWVWTCWFTSNNQQNIETNWRTGSSLTLSNFCSFTISHFYTFPPSHFQTYTLSTLEGHDPSPFYHYLAGYSFTLLLFHTFNILRTQPWSSLPLPWQALPGAWLSMVLAVASPTSSLLVLT